MNNFFETSKKAKKRRLSILVWLFRTVFKFGILLVLAAVVGLSGLYFYLTQQYGDQLNQRYPTLSQNSHVYDVNGDKVATFRASEERETVGILLVLAAVVGLSGLYFYLTQQYGDQLNQRYPTLSQNSHVYDVNGPERWARTGWVNTCRRPPSP